ncbi:MAG: aldo/keto reductase [Bacteroidetes bacterium]|nr:aldo/keto reductase [Bacteroidota bacterium]
MKFRKFGNTDLIVSEIGFGAWGIGGPAMAGNIPIGWGEVNDSDSLNALKKSFDLGINFYDTADFYGLGHSEELIGRAFGNSDKIIVATKVGHRLTSENSIFLDYSKQYIIEACERSLSRLKRDVIDYYQLHSAKLVSLEEGGCIEAMLLLQQQGKIRYWGLSLNTFNPFPEAEFLMNNSLGNGFQLVLNIINQKAGELIEIAGSKGYGIIARMPLQFGLLTGKFTQETVFTDNDHRKFRLTPEILKTAILKLKPIWNIADNYGISKTSLALSFILNFAHVSTVIPGIKTADQVVLNCENIIKLTTEDFNKIKNLYKEEFLELIDMMKQAG